MDLHIFPFLTNAFLGAFISFFNLAVKPLLTTKFLILNVEGPVCGHFSGYFYFIGLKSMVVNSISNVAPYETAHDFSLFSEFDFVISSHNLRNFDHRMLDPLNISGLF